MPCDVSGGFVEVNTILEDTSSGWGLNTSFMANLLCEDGDGVTGGVNRDGDGGWMVIYGFRGSGVINSRFGVGGGVSGCTRLERTGNARFC
jgi:hypothetical protein